MSCSQCQGIEELFSKAYVDGEPRQYRRRGPDRTTCILTNALKDAGVQGLTLLDIGGGLGAVQHEMFAAGIRSATDIDASAAYLAAARAESRRRGLAEQIRFQHGNFVDLVDQIEPANIVTLDRVICCYHEMEKLVGLSAARARKYLGLVSPRDNGLTKVGIAIENFLHRIRSSPFRAYIHASEAVDALIMSQGLQCCFHQKTLSWQVFVYEPRSLAE